MLTLRKRGRYWYIRGTVKVGSQTIRVPEVSTGTTSESDAREQLEAIATDTRRRLLHGTSRALDPILFEQAALNWLGARRRHAADVSRVGQLNDYFAGFVLQNITADDFADFCRKVIPGRHPNTQGRVHTVLRSIFRLAGVPFPDIPCPGRPSIIVQWLELPQADRLIAAYSDHAQPAAMIARYMGLRAGEIARLERRDVDLAGASVFVRESKSGKPRWVPIHPTVLPVLEAVIADHSARGTNHPFLLTGRHGAPYADTRGLGGNPFTKAHTTACRRAGIGVWEPALDNDGRPVVDRRGRPVKRFRHTFRFHDWRHHFATWFLRMGGDLRSLQAIGGWSSLDQLERYAAVVQDHARELMSRVG